MATTKVVFIITQLQLGGAQRSVLYSAMHLDKNLFDVCLLSGPGGYFDDWARQNIDSTLLVPALRRKINPFKDFTALRQLGAALRCEQADIVHTNSSKAGILGRLAARFLAGAKKPKIVHTVHGFSFHNHQNFLVRRFYILLERWIAKFTDMLVFVSTVDLQTALALNIAPAHKCRLIRAGVELKTPADFAALDKPAKRAEFGLDEHNKIILSIANLKPQKNPLDMVRAAGVVCAQRPEAVFLYLGSGPLKRKTEALIAKYKLQNNFKLLGDRPDADELLALADVFALSSLWEGLPMALVEALSMQVPAVCYDAGGIGAMIQDGRNGFLIPSGDWRALAQGILEVLEGRAPFDAAAVDLQDFDIKKMPKNQEKLYLELLGQ